MKSYLPVALSLAVPLGRASALVTPQTVEVPLELYTDENWPEGVQFGGGYGVSFLDFDRDGWADLYSNGTATLWRNEEGRTWRLTADLDAYLPAVDVRYGASCADYDNDGLPDIATEPYIQGCFYFLKNLGRGRFIELASKPAFVVGQPCGMYSETACWGDVDSDGDLDLFVPAYPDWVIRGSGGNRFWENLGPVGPRNAYRLSLSTPAAGLEIPANYPRPEGAQFCDVDRDGDLDLFSNHVLYQNVSAGRPSFVPMRGTSTGITFTDELNSLDEGATFLDYDLDGDDDLFVLYTGSTLRLWENRGDATFFPATAERIDQPRLLPWTGLSGEDWDQDGDLDLVAGRLFRRNQLVESGVPFLQIVTASVPAWDRSVAWADWDHDGDLDCVFKDSRFRNLLYRNTTYGTGTAGQQNRSLRVRVVRDSESVAGGLETEFGAVVELRVRGDRSGFVRRRFVASSHGYIQQNEYALTLALPSGPDPLAPAEGVYFDLAVDFTGRPEQGLQRIDANVNPALGAIHLAKLAAREITVHRSGRVELDGRKIAPLALHSTLLCTTGGGPPSITADATLPAPSPAPNSDWFTGLAFTTGDGPVRVEELILDGVLADAQPCKGIDSNVALWDVTAPHLPRLVWTSSTPPRARNRRQFLPVGVELQAKRSYRLVCHVRELRLADLGNDHTAAGGVHVLGGLSFEDPEPCAGASVASADPDPARTCVWLRIRARQEVDRPVSSR